MPRLTLLNGPPGIGKSTLAQRYVDEHPGALNLDIDQVGRLIGGFHADFSATFAMARTCSLAMARTHLRSGHDVVVPQYVGQLSELERFEEVARDSRSDFRHVVLMDGKADSIARFNHRGEVTEDVWLQAIHQHVSQGGGEAMLARMWEGLHEIVRSRLTSVLLPSATGDIDGTYRLLDEALSADSATTPPRAVAVVLEGSRVLVIRRHRAGVDYTVLPGGGVEPGESVSDAAVRELREETTLTARISSRLWHRVDDGRDATYFLMTDVQGIPMLSGEEATEHGPGNSFVLEWVTADALDTIRLQPSPVRRRLAALMTRPGAQSP